MKRTYEYCDKYKLPYKKVGKLVVATNDLEEKRLMDLWSRATQNQVPGLELVDHDGIKKREPACRGQKAIWSPETGIVDWGLVAKHYGKVFTDHGGTLTNNFEASKFEPLSGNEGVKVTSSDGKHV